MTDLFAYDQKPQMQTVAGKKYYNIDDYEGYLEYCRISGTDLLRDVAHIADRTRNWIRRPTVFA